MASSREMQPSARPLTHRPSLSSTPSNGPAARQTHARNNSHSLLTSSLNPNHRVTRRKSVTNPGTNVAALTAALRDANVSAAVPIATTPVSRRNTLSKGTRVVSGQNSLPSPPASLPNKGMADVKRGLTGSAIDDTNDSSAEEDGSNPQKARVRRASDGQPLAKDGKKSARAELRCEKCGKGYKHSSCLTKHLWEHTPEWSYTSKLLISKHQQVQLLEAASVLVAMNDTEQDRSPTPPASLSDRGSSSPAASGYSGQAGRQSSADTTPPPMSEGINFTTPSYHGKRHSSTAGLPRSYQSPHIPSGSVPQGHGFGHARRISGDRPTSSGANATNQDDRDLAAAVELLSCSFGSNNGSRGTLTLPTDAPPVPPVPMQYLDQAASFSSTGFINSFPSRQPESFTRGEFRRDSRDVKMDDKADSIMDDDDFDLRSRAARSDEDDDGVFGRMEE